MARVFIAADEFADALEDATEVGKVDLVTLFYELELDAEQVVEAFDDQDSLLEAIGRDVAMEKWGLVEDQQTRKADEDEGKDD